MSLIMTVSERLAEMMSGVKDSCCELLEKHASIHREPTRGFGGETRMGPWGPRRFGGGVSLGYSIWKPLSPEGTQAQAEALRRYQAFANIARTLLTGQPQNVLKQFDECDQIILAAVQQQGWPRRGTPRDALMEVQEALDSQQSAITNLYDGSDNSAVIVPDTNAFLYNTSLEDWTFDGISRFTMILLPTILKELDKLKITSRDEFRKKVEGLITRIKGYRGRGQLNEGVTLRRGMSTLRSVATEPSMAATLPWLDAANDDDRLLASALEVMRQYPHSAVFLVTRDINLQNKAEFAKVCFIEPPEVKAVAT